MDQKVVKSKNKLLKFLPKAASAVVTFQNLPFSPNRDKRSSCDPYTNSNKHSHKTHMGIISIIPPQARLKTKNSSFETQEPTSPKISCMGQIKHKKDIRACTPKPVSISKQVKRFASFSGVQNTKPSTAKQDLGLKKNSTVRNVSTSTEETCKKKSSAFRNVFKGKTAGRKSDVSNDQFKPPVPDRAPSLGQMKRFASGRDTFSGFDWTAQIAPGDRNCFSDDERGDSDNEQENEVFSKPMGLKLQPRKEINLWKRRTMDQPKPLQLSTM